MTDVQITREGKIFKYSPLVDGYSNGDIFKTLTGTPAISSNLLRLNADEIGSLESFRNASLEIYATIPAVPTAGDVRALGFKSLDNGNLGRCEFEVNDAVFSAVVYDAGGTLIERRTINWSSAWTALPARYRVTTFETGVVFAINDTIVARYDRAEDKEIISSDKLSKQPLEIHVSNSNADNLDVTSISVV